MPTSLRPWKRCVVKLVFPRAPSEEEIAEFPRPLLQEHIQESVFGVLFAFDLGGNRAGCSLVAHIKEVGVEPEALERLSAKVGQIIFGRFCKQCHKHAYPSLWTIGSSRKISLRSALPSASRSRQSVCLCGTSRRRSMRKI